MSRYYSADDGHIQCVVEVAAPLEMHAPGTTTVFKQVLVDTFTRARTDGVVSHSSIRYTMYLTSATDFHPVSKIALQTLTRGGAFEECKLL